MGTRSITIMQDAWEDHKEIVVLYRQMDGYPDGHGKELAEFLSGFKLVNGYNSTDGKVANGGGCLAAQIVAHFKDGVGQFYLHPAGSRDLDEEYIYTVIPDYDTGKITLIVKDVYEKKILFTGRPEDYNL